jgi:glycosyltransferase involved in cell wall biosynthesis
VAVTFLEAESVLLSRLFARRGGGSVAYLAGAIDLRWARRDRSTRRVATSQVIAERYRQHGLRCDDVVTPGVAAGLLDGPPPRSPSGGLRRLLYVGRLEPNKRVEWLLRVLRELPDASLRLIGDGPSRPAIERLADDFALAHRVAVLGPLPRQSVVAEMREADVFVFPSAYESFGATALEALAVGLPVVATDLPALREATGAQAALVLPDDLSAWISTIRRLLDDGPYRRTVAEAGRAWAAQFTWDRIVDRFERHVLEASRAPCDASRAV